MLRDRWLLCRNTLLASPRFQRLALRFGPTRGVARAHARRLFDLVAGFAYSQTLLACVELDLFARLVPSPAAITDLAAATGVPPAGMVRLVDAAVALELLARLDDGRITLGTAGAALVGNPGVAAMVAHHRALYADLADPVALLRQPGEGALARFWAYAEGATPAVVAAYSTLMATSIDAVAAELLDAYDLSRHRRLLDVGGGEGRFLAAVGSHAPTLGRGLFDLPAVIDRARVGDKVALHPGDFHRDPLPGGYDCVSLVRVLHDHDDPAALALLRAIRAALTPGGTLLIAEPMAGIRGIEPVGAAYFGLYFQAMGRGRARAPEEIGAMLQQSGFTRWRALRTRLPLVTSVVTAVV